METFATNQNNFLPVQVSSVSQQMQAPTDALVTNVELRNGKTASIITMYNRADFNFEEINMCVNKAINIHIKDYKLPVVSSQSTIYRIKNRALIKTIEFIKTIFE